MPIFFNRKTYLRAPQAASPPLKPSLHSLPQCLWRRLLRVPWTARRSNQSILRETSPGISLEGMMQKRNDAKAETPVLWPPHVKSCLIGKDSDVGRDWGQEEKGTTEDEIAGWHHWLDGCEFWVNSGSWWWTGRPGVLRFMGLQRVRHDWATELRDEKLCLSRQRAIKRP